MSFIDWDFYGAGVQSIISVDGSNRSQLAGYKWMLYNGNPALADSEIVADIRRYGDFGNSQGGLILRSDVNLMNCYYLERDFITSSDGYLLTKTVNGVRTNYWSSPMGHSPEDWARVRFRVDGWQISVHEWINGEWIGRALFEDVDQSHAFGYAGLFGANTSPNSGVLFDNVEIAEKT